MIRVGQGEIEVLNKQIVVCFDKPKHIIINGGTGTHINFIDGRLSSIISQVGEMMTWVEYDQRFPKKKKRYDVVYIDGTIKTKENLINN
jgi:hypothetical protein